MNKYIISLFLIVTLVSICFTSCSDDNKKTYNSFRNDLIWDSGNWDNNTWAE